MCPTFIGCRTLCDSGITGCGIDEPSNFPAGRIKDPIRFQGQSLSVQSVDARLEMKPV